MIDENKDIKSEIEHEMRLMYETGELISCFIVAVQRSSVAVEFDESGDIPMPLRNARRETRAHATMITIRLESLSPVERIEFAKGLSQLAKTIRQSVFDE